MHITIRPLIPEDYRAAARIFFCAIHEGTGAHYTPAQRSAWAGETIDLDRWRARMADPVGFVAEIDGEPVGFVKIDPPDYIDLAYVFPSLSGRGVGSHLLAAAEDWARARGTTQLTTHASLRAEAFFASNGWKAIARETVLREGISLDRFQMMKDLI